MRTRPYRNTRIIAVLHDLFFSRSPTSFVQRHEDIFPIYHSSSGPMKREVPIPMVALVATAVSITNAVQFPVLISLQALCGSP